MIYVIPEFSVTQQELPLKKFEEIAGSSKFPWINVSDQLGTISVLLHCMEFTLFPPTTY